ncbi:MAG: hypothetical protein AABZ60_23980, partial [Planctomycetota bacterium]
ERVPGNPAAGNFYPTPSGKKDPHEIQEILQKGYGNPDPDKNMYIDFYVTDATMNTKKGSPLLLPYLESFITKNDKVISPATYIEINILDYSKTGWYSPYFTIVGVNKLLENSGSRDLGWTPKGYPFIFIASGTLKNPLRDPRDSTFESTLIHEVGHILSLPDLEDLTASSLADFKDAIPDFLRNTDKDFHHVPKEEGSTETNLSPKEELLDLAYDYLNTQGEHQKGSDLWKAVVNCHFSDSSYNKTNEICSRDIRILRNSTARYFWYGNLDKNTEPLSYFYD